MYDRNRNEPEECRLQQETANKADFLTVHGLWPGLPKSIAARGVDERRWMRYGCATRPLPDMPEVKANRKCQAAETGLSLEMANKLNSVMPGAAAPPASNVTNTPNMASASASIPTAILAPWCA